MAETSDITHMKRSNLMLLMITLTVAVPSIVNAAEEGEPPPGEGVICALGIYSAVAEVGKQCFPSQDLEFQEGVNRAVAKLDAYVLKNSETTKDDLARLKYEQSRVGKPKDIVCSSDMLKLYQGMARNGAGVEAAVDKLVSRPGKPTWGSCL